MEPLFTLAVSTRALFQMDEEDTVFRRSVEEGGGVAAFRKMQQDRINVPPAPGVAFPLVKKLSDLGRPMPGAIKIVILSRNDAISGVRSLNAAKHYGIDIESGAFRCGESPLAFLELWKADLFLSADEADVAEALAQGFPAGLVWPQPAKIEPHPDELRVALDADACIFSAESEQFFQAAGGGSKDPATRDVAVAAFRKREYLMSGEPMAPGPMKPFLAGLHRLQEAFPGKVRTGIFTMRDAGAVERCLRTLNGWGVEVDEAFPLGGADKAPFLVRWGPSLFVDDGARHCALAASSGIPTAQVPM
jgi:5'-nucleotidase